MTILKASTISLGLAGAFALGVWTAPHFRDINNAADMTPTTQVVEPAAMEPAPAPVKPIRTTKTARLTRADMTEVEVSAVSARALSPNAVPVQRHAKALLNKGTDLNIASEGFRDATEFVTVAYAARNTEIPFLLLKHRVLNEGQTLSEAIRASKPQLDAVREMERARTKARADLSRLSN